MRPARIFVSAFATFALYLAVAFAALAVSFN
jgi:hypothetical protein